MAARGAHMIDLIMGGTTDVLFRLRTSSLVSIGGPRGGRATRSRGRIKSLQSRAVGLMLLFTLVNGILEIWCNLTPMSQQAHPLSLPNIARDPTRLANFTMTREAARQSKQQAEEEDGFIMRTVTANETRLPEGTETPTTNFAPEEAISTTTDAPQQPMSGEDDRIAINATRQQFVTHDQLLSAATKDEQISLQSTADQQSQLRRPPAAASASSRSAMPRLGFASSFLSDLLFRPRTTAGQQQQQSTDSIQFASTTTQVPITSTETSPQTQAPQQQQQQQPKGPAQNQGSCPGVCLNLFVASLRCQNAIPAPCPSILQKCCEVDDVSFNGTPVETSAPIPPGDVDPNSPAPHADVQQNSQPIGNNEQESSQSNVRPEAAVVDKQAGQQASSATQTPAIASKQSQPQPQPQHHQVPPSLSSDSRVSGAPGTEATESQHRIVQDYEQSRSIYFLSSGVDSSDTQQADRLPPSASPATLSGEQDVKSVDQKQQQFPASKPQAPAAGDLAQSSSDHRSTASQSFDPPLTTTTTSTSKPQVVAIQTANGTAYLHSGQSSTYLQSLARPHSRPLYANWTDYHLHMMHSRLPANQPQLQQQQQQQHNPVVYHSNIDPVRKYSTNPGTTTTEAPSTSTRQANDLKGATPEPDSESKVLKDQHSAFSRRQSQSEHSISQTAGASTPKTTPMTTSSVPPATEEPQPVRATPEQGTTDQPSALENDQVHEDSGVQQDGATASPVSGIANFLGSLFDSFMLDGSSGPNEARGTTELTSAQSESSLLSSSSSSSPGEQHNDRRLGLDLSFRQQNEMSGHGNESFQFHGSQEGENLMTSDESAPQVSHGQLQACKGYCAQRQFWNLCDSHYPSSDCGRSQECCVTSAASALAADASHQDATPATTNPSHGMSSQSQACRGACLPIYHSSLCMKPNEIQTDHPSCLTGQFCCSHPPVMVDDNNNLEDTSDSDASATGGLAHQTPSLAGVSDGSSSKDHSLSVALVPPPPPTVSGASGGAGGPMDSNGVMPDGKHFQSSLSGHMIPYSMSPHHQSSFAASQQPARNSPTSRPLQYQTATTKTANQQTASTSGGIMNQIFNMFKSSSATTKQRPRPMQAQSQLQQQQSLRHAPPQQIIYEVAPTQQLPVHSLPQQQVVTSPGSMRPNIHSLPQQQVVFPHLHQHQHQQQQQQQQIVPAATGNLAVSNNALNSQVFIAPNGQSFVAAHPGGNYELALGGQKQLVAGNSYQPDQVHYFADPIQFAASLQAQVSQRPLQSHSPQVKQHAQQVGANQFHLQSPSLGHAMVTNEQQQIALINAATNQLNYINQRQHQQQQHQVNQQQHPQQQQQQQHRQQPVQVKPSYPPSRPMVAHHALHSGAPNLVSVQKQQQQQHQHQHQHQQQQQQQLTNWAHPGQGASRTDPMVSSSSSGSNNAHQYHRVQPTGQQSQFAYAKPNQAQPHQENGGNLFSFGPADVASTVAGTSSGHFPQQQQQQQSAQPIGGSNSGNTGASINWQAAGWHASSPSEHDSQHVSNTNLEQQKVQRPAGGPAANENNGRLPAPITPNKAHQPEADANIVSSFALQQSTPKRPLVQLAHMSGLNQVSVPQRFTSKQPSRESGLPKIVPTTTTTTTTTSSTTTTSTTTQLPPVRPGDESASTTGLASSPSNLTPIHAPASDSVAEDGDMADSSQPRPVSTIGGPMESGPVGQKMDESGPVHSSPSTNLHSNSGQSSDNEPAPADDGDSAASGGQQQQQPSQSDPLIEVVGQGSTLVSAGGVNLLAESVSSTVSSDYEQPASTRAKVSTTACGLPGPDRLGLNSVGARARAGRVMGGFNSEPGFWCWQVALMNSKNEYLCGGALIGTTWVITAAHCVTQHLRNESKLYVRLGQTNLNSSSLMERRSAKSALVKTSYVHHNHNGVTLDNDIALLRLEDSVDLSEPGICTICLPERNSKPLEVGRRCTVTGYGFENEQGPAALRVRQTDLPIVSDDQCQSQTSKILQKPFVLPASSFCAGGELGQDACHGDGGSPLACQVDGYYELSGIVSWGYKCGSKDLPGLYAKVSNFVGWINQIVSVNS